MSNQLKDLDSKQKEILEKLDSLQIQRKAFMVAEDALHYKQDSPLAGISSISQKVALFCSFFKGRKDLYAQRWESVKTGKFGYQPVCKNDWIRGICRKPQIKCGECAVREFVPLSANVIQRHLFGLDTMDRSTRRARRDFVIGVYPLLQDETRWFLAVDTFAAPNPDFQIGVKSAAQYQP